MPLGHRPGWPRIGETLRRERNPPRDVYADAPHTT
jgi:hypothetical protein